jgi:hypothetical protein
MFNESFEVVLDVVYRADCGARLTNYKYHSGLSHTEPQYSLCCVPLSLSFGMSEVAEPNDKSHIITRT